MSLLDAWARSAAGDVPRGPLLFHDGRAVLHAGDCLEAMRGMAADSIDSVVCDPPYHLTSIVKRFGSANSAPARSNGATGVYARASTGFMGKTWDGGDVAFRVETWAEVLRVLKPGGHLVAFGGTRTYHRLVCAIEDAGFEVRDQLAWIFGSGFPKSLDVSKAIDKAAGATREVVGVRRFADGTSARATAGVSHEVYGDFVGAPVVTAAATDAAKQWEGWGTALKPAHEPIVLARKPLAEGTVAANVLRWGTGVLNVDGCRVGGDVPTSFPKRRTPNSEYVLGAGFHKTAEETAEASPLGRWPANVCTDGSPEVLAGFPQTNGRGNKGASTTTSEGLHVYGKHTPHECGAHFNYDAGGSAARFFYCAKASARDRVGSKHPTVKPVSLMRWLVRLVTPPGGTVLDPFAGSGTTGQAALEEGFRVVMCEKEAEYQADIAERMRRATPKQEDGR